MSNDHFMKVRKVERRESEGIRSIGKRVEGFWADKKGLLQDGKDPSRKKERRFGRKFEANVGRAGGEYKNMENLIQDSPSFPSSSDDPSFPFV